MTLPLALLGAGLMGSLHARAAGRSGVASVALVVDPHEARGSALASSCGAEWFPTLDAAGPTLEACGAAIVATPTSTHADLAIELMERGLDVLVEKPLGRDADEARSIVAAAQRTGRVAAVGHVERFNPVTPELEALVREPVFVQAHRLSPYGDQIHDGVILDLMLHDLDLVLGLLDQSPVRSVSASAVRTRSRSEDLATCILELESGLVVQLNASRISQRKVRTFQVTMAEGVLDADLLLRTIHVSRDTTGELVEDGTRRFRQHTVTEIPWVTGGEPLVLQLQDFVRAATERCAPTVGLDAGVRVIELCHRIQEAALHPDSVRA